jgi:MerR family transcriptional regulator, copper efflux regulator
MQATGVDALTINEAAETTGWSARMLRYIESIGLVEPGRSGAGYRLYGPAELQRLSTLRELLDAQELDLGAVGFALRLERDPRLREAIELWLAAEPARPEHVCWPIGDLFDLQSVDWLRFEQEKHQRLLASAGSLARTADPTAGDRSNDDRRSPEPHTSPHTTTMEIA